ncbi:piercer of microtubule wall 2 protein [Paroedura picta]|uniref:piercer of microtubule wall 2 protein n=1 Tax=Paroedura picta TaxID=143630 RepID=UPI004056EFEF
MEQEGAVDALPRPSSTEGAAASSWHLPCASPGNPVFSCMLDPAVLTTSTRLTKPRLLLYKTTSSDYGAVPPTTPMAPCRYYPKDNSLTDHLFACGKTQHNGINTGLDKSKVYDHPDLLNLL